LRTEFNFALMDSEQKPQGNLLMLALLAPLAGAVVGFVAVIFRLALQRLDSLRSTAIGWAHGGAFTGFLFVVVLCAAATALAAWLVRRYSPDAAG
jgi:CIC family chloride channel protein